ncbi:MAG: 23S rRNA (guanosine(2251)-2'-O)-methyltransferase RlmB, partial [Ignavibacteriales bacterium UTCHB3]
QFAVRGQPAERHEDAQQYRHRDRYFEEGWHDVREDPDDIEEWDSAVDHEFDQFQHARDEQDRREHAQAKQGRHDDLGKNVSSQHAQSSGMVMKRKQFENRRRDKEGPGRRIYGIHVVHAWLAAEAGAIKMIWHDEAAGTRVRDLVSVARDGRIPIRVVSRERLDEIASTTQHQGIAALCEAFPYVGLESVLEKGGDLVVVLDHIQDPHNLGAIIRSAEAVGAAAVVLPKDRAAGMTPAAEVAAAGASAWIPIVRVVNLARALDSLKAHRYWVAALALNGGSEIYSFEAPAPLVLVVGGEVGVHALIQKKCDFSLKIPMWGRSESLNASVAAGVALFEVRRRLGKP